MKIDRRSFVVAASTGVGLAAGGVSLALSNAQPNTSAGTVLRSDVFPKLPIGMNLAPIADWEPGFPFRNLFLGARPWLTRNVSGSGPHDTKSQSAFSYDNDGYALQVPVTAPGLAEPQTIFTYLPNCRTAGHYILLYDGEGEFEGLSSTRIVSQKPGRVKLQMLHDPEKYEAIVIKRSARGNHVRNIRLVAEADETTDLALSPYLPEFIEFCRPFHCLRFMDWGATNGSIEENWENRKSPTFYTQVGKTGDPDALYSPAPTPFQTMFAGGVAFELMIQLCNELQINPWFCIPHRATDDYIAQFAQLVRKRLDPRLKVYVEFSNELWNWSFLQAGWMLRSPLAGAIVEANGGNPWKNQAKTEGKDHPERIGALFRRAFGIWEREWSGADRARLIRVCSVQAAWADASKRTVKWCADHGGADVVSPAAYVGPDEEIYERWAKAGASLTAEQVIADVQARIKSLYTNSSVAKIIVYAAARGLQYVSYEGGQHIQPKHQANLPYNSALQTAQYHPNMYNLYVELFQLHRDLGCSLFCHFNSVGRQGTRWGSWGAKQKYTEPDTISPKMKAINAVNIKNDVI